ncbi:MAG: hypothetical protein U0L88_04335 [Acutalibacteraceae bacterium]|nr:hypothetical protein [Acutalibacteraceae bacterium]
MYFLRAKQIGLTLTELEDLEIGFVFDLMIESGNDYYKYPELAEQDDIDRLLA